jgi:hypothetical protein
MPLDTSPDAYRLQVEALARLPAAERLRQALELSDLVVALSRAGGAARAGGAVDASPGDRADRRDPA